jgi:hypothetical protein
MAKYEKRLNGQIICLIIFYCKMSKTEEGMMGQFNGRFVYLRNFGKVAKYRLGKQSVRLIFGIKD